MSVAWAGACFKSVTIKKIPGDDQERLSPPGEGFRSKAASFLKNFRYLVAYLASIAIYPTGADMHDPFVGRVFRQFTRLLRSLAVMSLESLICLSETSAESARCCSADIMASSPTLSVAYPPARQHSKCECQFFMEPFPFRRNEDYGCFSNKRKSKYYKPGPAERFCGKN